MTIFAPGPSKDPEFEQLLRRPSHDADRELIDSWWRTYQPLNGDPHFLTEVRNDFRARVWEMYVACLLARAGFPLGRPAANAPDVLVESTPRVWVECVAVTAGTNHNYAGRVTSGNGRFKVPSDKIRLRYTQAISDKHAQLSAPGGFLERGAVGPNDAYIIALNASRIDDADLINEFPDIVRVLYALDDTALQIGFRTPPRPVQQYRPQLEKSNGATVAATGFASPTLSKVSAVLFSPLHPLDMPDLDGRGITVVHNWHAEVPALWMDIPAHRKYRVDNTGPEPRLEGP